MKNFKDKYFTNNFYWVDKANYLELQRIGLELGCLCHTKEPEIINWHEGFVNLAFRTYEKNDNITVFQKEPFLLGSEKATSFNEMFYEYKLIKSTIMKIQTHHLINLLSNAPRVLVEEGLTTNQVELTDALHEHGHSIEFNVDLEIDELMDSSTGMHNQYVHRQDIEITKVYFNGEIISIDVEEDTELSKAINELIQW